MQFELQMTPEEFELAVEVILARSGADLSDWVVRHREMIPSGDGEFEIDITARFRALDVEFLVLIECKRHRHPIKRDVVQVLHDRLRSVGAQKGIVVSTSSFQRGAVEYATRHGIALIRVVDGASEYVRRIRSGGYFGLLADPVEPGPHDMDDTTSVSYSLLRDNHSDQIVECWGTAFRE